MSTQKAARKHHKKNWEKIVKSNDFDGFDQDIVPLLKDMNNLKGLTTVFSCTGHDFDQSNFYMSCAVSKKGTKTLWRLFKKLNDKLNKQEILIGHLEIEGGALIPDKVLAKELKKCKKEEDRSLWHTLCLRYYFNETHTAEHVKLFQNMLHGEVIGQLIVEKSQKTEKKK